ncbi:MAG: hypothetical protein JJU45_04375 [Acidimicrobiia bacterium]|nr:hypothetical protein [Acidimicrobiia bacterium]
MTGSTGRGGVVVVLLGGAVVGLHRSAERLPPLPSTFGAPTELLEWVSRHEPLLAVVALLRPLLVGLGSYLVAVSLLLWSAQALRRPGVARGAMRLVIPSLRPLLRAAGLGVAVSAGTAVLAPTPPADQAPAQPLHVLVEDAPLGPADELDLAQTLESARTDGGVTEGEQPPRWPGVALPP